MGDQLGDHRVVVHGHFAAFLDAGVHAHVGRLQRRAVADEPTDGRQEVAERILGVDAGLQGPAVELHVLLGQRQLLAGGDADHQFHQVDAGDHLRHRVLHLQAGIHFQEIEVAFLVDDELHGARRAVVHRPGQGHRLLAHGLAGFFVQQRGGGFFEHLLVAALDRAFALAQVDDVAVLVGQHLDLDVPRFLDVLLGEDAAVAEGRDGLVGGPLEPVPALGVVVHHAHALAAAAGGGLEHHRVADLPGDLHGMVGAVDDAGVAGNGGDAGLLRQLLGGDLVAHAVDGVDLRADEDDAGLRQGLGEGRPFRTGSRSRGAPLRRRCSCRPR